MIFVSPGGSYEREVEVEEEEEGYSDDAFCTLLQQIVEYVYDVTENPIDMHIRTDGHDITIVVCRNDPAAVHFYSVNAKEFFDYDSEDAEDSLNAVMVAGFYEKPFEAEMLSRAFIEHILLNQDSERTES